MAHGHKRAEQMHFRSGLARVLAERKMIWKLQTCQPLTNASLASHSIDYVGEFDLLHTINIYTPLPLNSLLRAFVPHLSSHEYKRFPSYDEPVCYHYRLHLRIDRLPFEPSHIFDYA
jgi:hypothetical protein